MPSEHSSSSCNIIKKNSNIRRKQIGAAQETFTSVLRNFVWDSFCKDAVHAKLGKLMQPEVKTFISTKRWSESLSVDEFLIIFKAQTKILIPDAQPMHNLPVDLTFAVYYIPYLHIYVYLYMIN